MAVRMPGLPGDGGCTPQIERLCLWFYGNLIRAHLAGRLEAGLKWSNLDTKQRENDIL